MIENSDIALIDRHLKNELSPDELNDFNIKLKSDKEFRDFFEMMKPLGLVVERSNLKMNLAEFENELAQADKGSDAPSNYLRNKIFTYSLIAIGVVLIVILGMYISKTQGKVEEPILPNDSQNLANDSSVVDSAIKETNSVVSRIDSTVMIHPNQEEYNCKISDSKLICSEEGSRIIRLTERKSTLFICLTKNATLIATDTGYLYTGPNQFAIELCYPQGKNTTLSGSGCSLSSKGNGTYICGFSNSSQAIKISVSEKNSSLGSVNVGTFNIYVMNNSKQKNLLMEDIKSSGKVSFWTDSGEDGIVKIYIDDKFVGQLDSYFESGKPLFGQKGTFTYSLPVGEHSVFAESSNREASGKIIIEAGDSIIYKLFK